MRIVGGRWYKNPDNPVPLTPTGIRAIETIIQCQTWTDIRELSWAPDGHSGTALIEWRSLAGYEVAVFEWEGDKCSRPLEAT